MDNPLHVVFFRLDSGKEPVRDWIRSLSDEHRKTIGEDIKTLQFGWAIGMPLARKLKPDLWELRTMVSIGIIRVFFTIYENNIVLVHGFIIKSQRTPLNELNIAKRRLNILRS